VRPEPQRHRPHGPQVGALKKPHDRCRYRKPHLGRT
jgi:hypothetical protein